MPYRADGAGSQTAEPWVVIYPASGIIQLTYTH